MSKEEYKQAVQALNGSLARFSTTTDLEELKTIYVSVRKRLEMIYRYRYKKLMDETGATAGGTYIQQELFNHDK